MADGILPQILAQVDRVKRNVGRNVSDAIENPRDYGQKILGLIQEAQAPKVRSTEDLTDILGALVTRGTVFKPGDRIITKAGDRGTVQSVRQLVDNRVEDPNSPWMKKRQELADQAAQGYMDGQHSFDQYTQIFDRLLEQNKDTLQRLYKAPHPDGNSINFVPKILLEGAERPSYLNLEDIESVLSGPTGIIK